VGDKRHQRAQARGIATSFAKARWAVILSDAR
jgi:hypothetical protein